MTVVLVSFGTILLTASFVTYIEYSRSDVSSYWIPLTCFVAGLALYGLAIVREYKRERDDKIERKAIEDRAVERDNQDKERFEQQKVWFHQEKIRFELEKKERALVDEKLEREVRQLRTEQSVQNSGHL